MSFATAKAPQCLSFLQEKLFLLGEALSLIGWWISVAKQIPFRGHSVASTKPGAQSPVERLGLVLQTTLSALTKH